MPKSDRMGASIYGLEEAEALSHSHDLKVLSEAISGHLDFDAANLGDARPALIGRLLVHPLPTLLGHLGCDGLMQPMEFTSVS